MYETVNYTISPRLQLIDPSTGAVLASDMIGKNPNYTLDRGSATAFDPFLQYAVAAPAADKPLLARVTSVITYDKFYPQAEVEGVWGGISYDLIISVPGHKTNTGTLELKGKTLQIVDGMGAGQAGIIAGYDAMTKAYYLNLEGFDAWNGAGVPRFESQYDILSRMSQETPLTGPSYADQLSELPITDYWNVVLTQKPTAGKEVIVNIVPTATRTYDADQAFNPDAAFGENTAEQVRVATKRAVIQLGGTAARDEYWVVTLSGLDTRLSVEAYLEEVFRRLRDGDLSDNETIGSVTKTEAQWLSDMNSDVVFYRLAAGEDVNRAASELARLINDGTTFNADYTAAMTPGLAVDLANAVDPAGVGIPVAQNDKWALSLSVGGTPTAFEYIPTAGDTLSTVAAGLAARISLDSRFEATADGSRLLILARKGNNLNTTSGPFSGALVITTPAPNVTTRFSGAIGAQAPQILVTAASAFYAELAIGVDVGTNATPRVL
ncbi:MAG: hypothetical protein K2X97_06395, partial [Mycobacteriaceae bacterium]|nr:hypothetical protein [Mycobacteriaceae bacterium]